MLRLRYASVLIRCVFVFVVSSPHLVDVQLRQCLLERPRPEPGVDEGGVVEGGLVTGALQGTGGRLKGGGDLRGRRKWGGQPHSAQHSLQYRSLVRCASVVSWCQES